MSRKSLTDYWKTINRPLILDGAIGSQLQMSGVKLHPYLWTSFQNISNPQAIIELHKNYIEAGADIITTNTFRTNPLAYEKAKISISNFDFVKNSVQLANSASKDYKNIIVAGSNPPAEDSYQRNRTVPFSSIVKNHEEHIEMLWESGVDILLNETQSHLDEIKVICEHCSKYSIPFVLSLLITEELRIFSGETLKYILDFVKYYSPVAVSLNCIFPNVFLKYLSGNSFNYQWGFYLNCGSSYYTEKTLSIGVSPFDYIKIVSESINEKLLFVGHCCGSNPRYTKILRDYFANRKS